MALDTGARQTTISAAMLEFVRCDLRRPFDHVRVVSATGTARSPRVIVPSLSCAGTTRHNLLVAVGRFPREFQGHGLLGLDFIRPGPLHIDFARGTVRIGQRRWWPFGR